MHWTRGWICISLLGSLSLLKEYPETEVSGILGCECFARPLSEVS